jgi:hypothetical protein
MMIITYGLGGFNASMPNNNIVSIEEIDDNRYYAVLKQNYVIDIIDNQSYSAEHDVIIETDGNVNIGDWYEEAEGIFYRPINALPPDVPEELQPLPPDVPEELQP